MAIKLRVQWGSDTKSRRLCRNAANSIIYMEAPERRA
jgi:hypothetical protein